MRFSVLSSGSKANSTFIECGGTRILIDCGLSCRMLEGRLRLIDVDPESLDAILVTHEHSDHTRGIARFSKKYQLPVYANRSTKRHIGEAFAFEIFNTGEAFDVGEFSVSPVSITHDAVEPVAFIVRGGGLKFAQVTDLGRVTPLIRDSLQGCHSLVLESNHDKDMLWSCSYSWQLKQRISSSHGHLSNETAGQLLKEVLHSDLHHVVLGHISENSNTPEVAHQTALRCIEGFEPKSLRCANVHQPTPLLSVAA
jgi:phosphoribosyl 1,2-cyclic phosphodiesterase